MKRPRFVRAVIPSLAPPAFAVMTGASRASVRHGSVNTGDALGCLGPYDAAMRGSGVIDFCSECGHAVHAAPISR